MGVRFRVFFVDNNDHLHKVPMKRFERLVLRKDSSERFPEFAGERMRYALIAVEVIDRRPVAITRADYSILKLNAKGKLDNAEWNRKLRLVMNTLPFPMITTDNTVIDASEQFSKKRYDHEFRWQPSPELEDAIEKAIFGNVD